MVLAPTGKLQEQVWKISMHLTTLLSFFRLWIFHDLFKQSAALRGQYLFLSSSPELFDLCTHLFYVRSIGSCSHCSPIIPIILVRQLQGQLHCIHPTGNNSSSAIRPNLSVLLHVPFADCIRRYCSYPLCHNNNTIKSAFVSISEGAWKVRGKLLSTIQTTEENVFPLSFDEDLYV